MKTKLLSILTILIVGILGFTLASCHKQTQTTTTDDHGHDLSFKKPTIVTTSFFSWDLARHIADGQDGRFQVENLYPLFEDEHDHEASAESIANVKKAKLLVITSLEQDAEIVKNENNSDLLPERNRILSLYTDVVNKDNKYMEKLNAMKGDNSEQNKIILDAPTHYWTSVKNAIECFDAIYNKIVELDTNEEHKKVYEANYNDYKSKLDSLQTNLSGKLNSDNKKTFPPIYYISHDAMGAFMIEYGLLDKYHPLQLTVDEDTEPSADEISSIVETIKTSKVNAFFIPETEASESVINSILQQTQKDGKNLKTIMLNAAHEITHEQYHDNITYYQILHMNLENINSYFSGK